MKFSREIEYAILDLIKHKLDGEEFIHVDPDTKVEVTYRVSLQEDRYAEDGHNSIPVLSGKLVGDDDDEEGPSEFGCIIQAGFTEE